MSRERLAAPLLACALLAGGCGVPLDGSANPVPANLLPPSQPAATADPSPSPTPDPGATAVTESPQSRLRLWFVQEDGLAAVESALPVGSPAEAVMAALALGPAPDQSEEGLRTIATDPLTGEPLVAVVPSEAESDSPLTGPVASAVPIDDPPVVVRLSPAFSALPSTEQVLLLGQVVLSLTGAGEGSVAFTDDSGTSVGVPLPDGRLLDVPATARDYNALIVRP
ncbi:MAG: hypothetical protein Q7V58_10820 [Actinomycetota bacterium]|nr:hypothetical protein [Actinomycetota bacterium]